MADAPEFDMKLRIGTNSIQGISPPRPTNPGSTGVSPANGLVRYPVTSRRDAGAPREVIPY